MAPKGRTLGSQALALVEGARRLFRASSMPPDCRGHRLEPSLAGHCGAVQANALA